MLPPSSQARSGSNRLLDLFPLYEQNRLNNELDEQTLALKQRFAHRNQPYAHIALRTMGLVLTSVLMDEVPPLETGL